MFSHRIHGIHRTDWQRMFSHRFHRFSQMLCFWSSVNSVCSVRPPTPPVDLCKSVQSVGGLFSTLLQNVLAEDVLPQNSRNSQNRLAEMFSHRFHGFSQMVRVWISVNSVYSVYSVYSVGLPTPPVNLCKSVQSVGGLFSTLLQNRLAEMFSHRIHRIHRTDWQRYSPTDFTDSHRWCVFGIL